VSGKGLVLRGGFSAESGLFAFPCGVRARKRQRDAANYQLFTYLAVQSARTHLAPTVTVPVHFP